MRQKLPIGVDDFREIRELGLEYVDKSQLVCDLLDLDARVVLAPRPRRFGKTVNLSMLWWFFERRDEDLSGLFEGLRVWDAGGGYREHFQRHPVISMSFKGTRHDTFEGCWEALRTKVEGRFTSTAPCSRKGSSASVNNVAVYSLLRAPSVLQDRSHGGSPSRTARSTRSTQAPSGNGWTSGSPGPAVVSSGSGQRCSVVMPRGSSDNSRPS